MASWVHDISSYSPMLRLDKRMTASRPSKVTKEREAIVVWTKSALAEAKAGGQKLGDYRLDVRKVGLRLSVEARQKAAEAFKASVGPMVAGLRDDGLSLRQIAARLTEQGIRTAKGGMWTAAAVKRVSL